MAQGVRRIAITPDVVNTHLREGQGSSAMVNEGGPSSDGRRLSKSEPFRVALDRMADDGCPNTGVEFGKHPGLRK